MSDWLALGFVSPSCAELCNEMEQCARAFDHAALRALMELDIPGAVIAELTGEADIGRARVEISKSGHWQPIGSGGIPSVIFPILDGGILVDLVAFSPRSPDSWALRRGDGWLLGAGNIPGAGDWENGARTVQIFANPLEWLRGGASGICVLSWDARAIMSLMSLGGDLTLIADSEALAQYIDSQMRAAQIFPSVIFDNSLILEAAA